MANKNLFQSIRGRMLRRTNAVNQEGAPAYQRSPEEALAQYAVTGCLNDTFYASAGMQLETVLSLCEEVDAEYIARTAIYAREYGYMKDMPALLCARLSVDAPELLPVVFERVIDNGKMLRNFVQIMRSGVVGRKSLGTLPKRLVRQWLESRSDEQIFRASVGNSPSIVDILKMVHPKPQSASREALYGYLIGRDYNAEMLPEIVRAYESYKADKNQPMPNVPFQMLTSLSLGKWEWTAIAQNASWQMTRMNLNTFARQGVFQGNAGEIVSMIAERLRDRTAIAKSRVFPYQLMMAYLAASGDIPRKIINALQDAMEIAVENVPAIEGKVYVCPDVSGSMTWTAATGSRKGATSKARCIDIAALVAAAVLRKNSEAEIIPFEGRVVKVRLNSRDSIMTNAEKLANIGGGSTNCSAPLKLLNKNAAKGDLVLYVSDNQSWVDARSGRNGTGMMWEWNKFRQRNPQAKLVCLDIQPYQTSQTYQREDILHVGGFSDQVFRIISDFAAGRLSEDYFTNEIKRISL